MEPACAGKKLASARNMHTPAIAMPRAWWSSFVVFVIFFRLSI
jgi:hypothetical protein